MKEDWKSQYTAIRQGLLDEKNEAGYWTGCLSTSALSTAVAMVALKLGDNREDLIRVRSGLAWLSGHINADGGYGDTTDAESNLSTTLLCYAAISLCACDWEGRSLHIAIEKYLEGEGVRMAEPGVVEAILKIYGKDLTFSVPIIAMLSLCGVVPVSSLDRVPGLPFELSILPAGLYRFFNLRVVSYALPALIAVGIYLHGSRSKSIALIRKIRQSFIKPAIRKLEGLLPSSGGFLEAIPLTGFVAMCLMACGEGDNRVVTRGLGFLKEQQRRDGGWPIDTDLSTWVSTLSVKALGPDIREALSVEERDTLRTHLLKLQYRERHPFNGARPGGWGWTSHTGSVPDADDTPGAILALIELFSGTVQEKEAILLGCRWLTGLQNRDGGFPTFCRGWGRLPFDKSCADLTGHAWLALRKTSSLLGREIPGPMRRKIEKSSDRALSFLEKQQAADGRWVPLWFGNQHVRDKSNPVYGTARVCTYLADGIKEADLRPGYPDIRTSRSPGYERIASMIRAGQNWLCDQQNSDGSWGAQAGVAGTVEETSLAISALMVLQPDVAAQKACLRGLHWLQSHKHLPAAPIGLYFAMLWYDERLYPIIFKTEALRRIAT